MKRFHVHVAVPDLDKGIRFYSTMFGAEPTVVKPDYAKWMLEDPRVNFAISERDGAAGVNHLGFQVDDAEELARMHSQLASADAGLVEEKDVSCCYARSDKYWITDPQGVAWETYHTLGEAEIYGAVTRPEGQAGACCAPQAEAIAPAPRKNVQEKCC